MKRTWLILGGIALVWCLLVANLLYQQRTGMIAEREWFARELHYEFSAQVDSIVMLNKYSGKLWCRVTGGDDPRIEREDSLTSSFKEHDMLYLIFKKSGDMIIFITPSGDQLEVGDSVHVSSETNTIQFFRSGKSVTADKLSRTLTSFGRPFFMKRTREL